MGPDGRVRACSACWPCVPLISRADPVNGRSQMPPLSLHLVVGVVNDLIGSSCSDSGAADLNQRLAGFCPAEPLSFLRPGGFGQQI